MSKKNKSTQEQVEVKENNQVVEVKAKDVAKNKKKKEKAKKPNKLAKSLKDTGNELKKVTWPGFKQVAKQIGIVLAFVFIFGIVLLGFDKLCSWLSGLLV